MALAYFLLGLEANIVLFSLIRGVSTVATYVVLGLTILGLGDSVGLKHQGDEGVSWEGRVPSLLALRLKRKKLILGNYCIPLVCSKVGCFII